MYVLTELQYMKNEQGSLSSLRQRRTSKSNKVLNIVLMVYFPSKFILYEGKGVYMANVSGSHKFNVFL